ncbi:hypothetical protein HDU67_006668 [Dinochytrium kinnereticum]|nr:hypothetical protein HDU67_006668 [Dinochytrium kinnereticum]
MNPPVITDKLKALALPLSQCIRIVISYGAIITLAAAVPLVILRFIFLATCLAESGYPFKDDSVVFSVIIFLGFSPFMTSTFYWTKGEAVMPHILKVIQTAVVYTVLIGCFFVTAMMCLLVSIKRTEAYLVSRSESFKQDTSSTFLNLFLIGIVFPLIRYTLIFLTKTILPVWKTPRPSSRLEEMAVNNSKIVFVISQEGVWNVIGNILVFRVPNYPFYYSATCGFLFSYALDRIISCYAIKFRMTKRKVSPSSISHENHIDIGDCANTVKEVKCAGKTGAVLRFSGKCDDVSQAYPSSDEKHVQGFFRGSLASMEIRGSVTSMEAADIVVVAPQSKTGDSGIILKSEHLPHARVATCMNRPPYDTAAAKPCMTVKSTQRRPSDTIVNGAAMSAFMASKDISNSPMVRTRTLKGSRRHHLRGSEDDEANGTGASSSAFDTTKSGNGLKEKRIQQDPDSHSISSIPRETKDGLHTSSSTISSALNNYHLTNKPHLEVVRPSVALPLLPAMENSATSDGFADSFNIPHPDRVDAEDLATKLGIYALKIQSMDGPEVSLKTDGGSSSWTYLSEKEPVFEPLDERIVYLYVRLGTMIAECAGRGISFFIVLLFVSLPDFSKWTAVHGTVRPTELLVRFMTWPLFGLFGEMLCTYAESRIMGIDFSRSVEELKENKLSFSALYFIVCIACSAVAVVLTAETGVWETPPTFVDGRVMRYF